MWELAPVNVTPEPAWLTLWLPLVLLGLLGRRDRRLLYALPLVGLPAAALLMLTGAWLTAAGSAWVFLAAVVAGGFGLPPLCVWGRAFLARDVPSVSRAVRDAPLEFLVPALIGLAATTAYLTVGSLVVTHWSYSDALTLFESDGPLYVRVMRDVAAPEYPVTHKHPAYALFAFTLHAMLAPFLTPSLAPVATSAIPGGVAAGLAAGYFRVVTGSKALGALLAVALTVSAGHLVFSAIPETYAWAAAAIILLHLLLALHARSAIPFRSEGVAAALAIGVTLTNGVVAIVCFAAARGWRPRRRALLRWAGMVFAILGLLIALQAVLLPQTLAYSDTTALDAETRYLASTTASEAVWNVARGVFAESVIGPRIEHRADTHGIPGIHAGAYSARPERIFLATWLTVLAICAATALARPAARRTTLAAALLCLIATAGLHLFYGNAHVFLFSCTFVFYLFALVAHGLRAMPRAARFLLAGLLLAVLLTNNTLFCFRWLAALEQA